MVYRPSEVVKGRGMTEYKSFKPNKQLSVFTETGRNITDATDGLSDPR